MVQLRQRKATVYGGRHMEKYTEYLEEKTWEAADEDYSKEALLEVVKAFRTFDAALNEFLLQHGYDGKIEDTEAKEAFIKAAFKAAGFTSMPRNIRQWFTEKKGIKRKTAFQICFAFGLNVEQSDEFFRRVMLERSFDCHMMEEAVYYFCIRNGLGYPEAVKLLEASPVNEVPKVTESKLVFDGDVLFTSAILKEVLQH